MATIKNAAYFGTSGEIVIDGDEHFGVTSCALVPNATDESVQDISGDVQGFVADAIWRLQLTFHQDHVTSGALSRQSIAWHGLPKTVEYTPQNGGDKLTVEVVWKAATVGGDTGRRSATLDLPVNGQPVVAAPTP